jgi:hypothetical protein
MTSVSFRKFIKEIHDDQVLIPVLKASLSNPDFQGFTIPVDGWGTRAYDGWFHPSTHATWSTRQLYHYLVHGQEMEPERPELLFVLAVTQGTFWHTLVQTLLADRGILKINRTVPASASITDQVEVPLLDKEHNRRGHADGRVAVRDNELFEFKTMTDWKIRKIKTADDIKILTPEYYAQTQDYLDMSGAGQMRYLIMSLASPFPMVEVVVPADKPFQAAQRQKYADALQAAADQQEPPSCCVPRSDQAKACPVRNLCPVGRLT